MQTVSSLWLLAAVAYANGLTQPHNCCNKLHERLPSLVHFPSSPEYQERHSTYYALQQRELFPACTVKPASTEDVSQILEFAEASHCQFAVASGGHMAWKGASNIDEGFVVDLRGLDMIEIVPSEHTAKLGPGSTWQSVYKEMVPYNLTVAGARISEVGVGGFLAGGGIAFKSRALGFGSNNVFNYEVVLANGSVVNANKQSHPDLFWALKLAGSNYGIITRFDMTTYHSPVIWGAVSVYPFTDQTVTEAFSDYHAYSHGNNNTDAFKAVVLTHQGRQKMIMTCTTTDDGVPVPPVTAVEPIHHLEKTGSTHDVVKDVIAAVLPGATRGAWFSFTTKATTNIALDIYKLIDEVYGSLLDKDGVSVCVNSQAFQKSFIEATRDSPVYNGMRESGEDLTLNLIMATWTDPADDEAMKRATDKLGKMAEKEARKRGVWTDFVYLNYANKEQSVYQHSLAAEDVTRMMQVRDAYDPKWSLEKLWRGGYKLPARQPSWFRANDEL